ncbi:DDE-type integrase/transposase/recombinase, partial [Escherichia coli]|uniref:DDE-type integrase/transposase/recombinase n=1 Tax=Escherichia coli TaxID=562 RepID=UPI003EDE802F
WRNPSDLCPWHMDETYVKVNGRWAYLTLAIDVFTRCVLGMVVTLEAPSAPIYCSQR